MSLEDWDLARGLRRFWWLAPPALLVLAVVAAAWAWRATDQAGGAKLEEEITQQYMVGDTAVLTVDNWAGDIHVVAGPPGRIEVAVLRQGSGDDEEAAFQDLVALQLRMTQDGDTVQVATLRPAIPGEQPHARADIRATVPAGTRLQLATRLGAVQLDGVEGEIDATSSVGEIDVRLPPDSSFRVESISEEFTTEFELRRERDPRPGVLAGTVGEEGGRVLHLHARSVTIRSH